VLDNRIITIGDQVTMALSGDAMGRQREKLNSGFSEGKTLCMTYRFNAILCYDELCLQHKLKKVILQNHFNAFSYLKRSISALCFAILLTIMVLSRRFDFF
jgi:hypothetical protein